MEAWIKHECVFSLFFLFLVEATAVCQNCLAAFFIYVSFAKIVLDAIDEFSCKPLESLYFEQ